MISVSFSSVDCPFTSSPDLNSILLLGLNRNCITPILKNIKPPAIKAEKRKFCLISLVILPAIELVSLSTFFKRIRICENIQVLNLAIKSVSSYITKFIILRGIYIIFLISILERYLSTTARAWSSKSF